MQKLGGVLVSKVATAPATAPATALLPGTKTKKSGVDAQEAEKTKTTGTKTKTAGTKTSKKPAVSPQESEKPRSA